MKKILLIIAILTSSSLPAMDAPRAGSRYQYKDENTVAAKRKIAVLAYGSLVNQRENEQTGARLESDAFRPTDTTFPISFLRKSNSGKITAVIDPNGQPKRLYYATSRFQFLPNARNNVAAREGAAYRGQESGYDLTNISYMKKLLPGKSPENNEQRIAGTQNWAVRHASQLPEIQLQRIANWADRNGFTALVWGSFPANLSDEQAAARELINNPALLQSTRQYVRQLADGAQTPFEKAVIAGRDALQQFAGQSEQLRAINNPPQRPVASPPAAFGPLAQQYPQILDGIPADLQAAFIQNITKFYTDAYIYPTLVAKLQTAVASADMTEIRKIQWDTLARMNGIPAHFKHRHEVFKVRDVDQDTQTLLGDLATEDLFTLMKYHAQYPDRYPAQQEYLIQQDQRKAAWVAGVYKIHLMPRADMNPTSVLLLILDLYKKDPEFKQLVPSFKIAPVEIPVIRGQVIPQVVFYITSGTNDAQKALNKIYAQFAAHPEIKGSGKSPRFNARVNDLIFIAQNHGDLKVEENKKYYELPSWIYLCPRITGSYVNYHLKHPVTGQELVQ